MALVIRTAHASAAKTRSLRSCDLHTRVSGGAQTARRCGRAHLIGAGDMSHG